MVTTPVLALPNFDKPFSIETDACDTGIGAVLIQEGHPISFYSKALGIKNQQLSTYEKEFFAVMLAVDKWHSYLQRGPFTILTDHKSLCTLSNQQLETEVQRRAMSKLVSKYKQGVDNGAVDALSRIGTHFDTAALSLCQPAWVQEVANSYEADQDAQELLQQLALQSPDDDGLELYRGMIRHHGRLWIGNNTNLCTKLINAMHDSAMGGQLHCFVH